MSKLQIIRNATIVNEGRTFIGSVVIDGELIKTVYEGDEVIQLSEPHTEVDATGLLLLPGLIDDQVHFRDPGLTYKEDLHTGSLAAAAGGFTSVICMANTSPVIDSVPVFKELMEREA